MLKPAVLVTALSSLLLLTACGTQSTATVQPHQAHQITKPLNIKHSSYNKITADGTYLVNHNRTKLAPPIKDQTHVTIKTDKLNRTTTVDANLAPYKKATAPVTDNHIQYLLPPSLVPKSALKTDLSTQQNNKTVQGHFTTKHGVDYYQQLVAATLAHGDAVHYVIQPLYHHTEATPRAYHLTAINSDQHLKFNVVVTNMNQSKSINYQAD